VKTHTMGCRRQLPPDACATLHSPQLSVLSIMHHTRSEHAPLVPCMKPWAAIPPRNRRHSIQRRKILTEEPRLTSVGVWALPLILGQTNRFVYNAGWNHNQTGCTVKLGQGSQNKECRPGQFDEIEGRSKTFM
jgi:hypothetical protein